MNSTEELREALVTLQRENERLRVETTHAQRLLAGLEHLLGVATDEDPFVEVFASLHSVFTFEEAMVLAESGDERLECIVGEPSSLVGLSWHTGSFFRKVMEGRVVATFSSTEIEEWRAAPPGAPSPEQPALYLPICVRERRGLLVLLRRKESAGFDRHHVALARRFSLLASHALASYDARASIREHQARALAAEEASNAKSLFIANVSHELRTPLNAVIGFSELIAAETLGPLGDPRYQTYLQDILSSGRHLLGVVNNLLLFAKIEAGQHRIELEPLELDDELQSALRLLRAATERRGIRLIVDEITSRAMVWADPQSLRQILVNVLGNAVKFSPSGASIRITLAPAPGSGRLRLSVSDDGCGIPPDTLGQLGSPFVQAEETFARRHQGTGLGLAISFALAESMNASLVIESEEGVGTAVHLDLPVAETGADEALRPGQIGSREARTVSAGGWRENFQNLVVVAAQRDQNDLV